MTSTSQTIANSCRQFPIIPVSSGQVRSDEERIVPAPVQDVEASCDGQVRVFSVHIQSKLL